MQPKLVLAIAVFIFMLSSFSFAAVPQPPSGFIVINSYYNTDGSLGRCTGTDFCCPTTGYSGSCNYKVYRYYPDTGTYFSALSAFPPQGSCAQTKVITGTAYCALYGQLASPSTTVSQITPTTTIKGVTTTTIRGMTTTTRSTTPTTTTGNNDAFPAVPTTLRTTTRIVFSDGNNGVPPSNDVRCPSETQFYNPFSKRCESGDTILWVVIAVVITMLIAYILLKGRK